VDPPTIRSDFRLPFTQPNSIRSVRVPSAPELTSMNACVDPFDTFGVCASSTANDEPIRLYRTADDSAG
jgi:hypothetical protein